MINAEYVRQDYFDPAGAEGRIIDPPPGAQPDQLNTLREVRRPVASHKRAECMGEPRLDILSANAWVDWVADGPTDPPARVLQTRNEIRLAYLVRFLPVASPVAAAPFVPPNNVEGNPITGPWGNDIVEVLEDGVTPQNTPGYGPMFWPSEARPWPRQNERENDDMVLSIWLGYRLQDIPAPPLGGNPVGTVHWNLYVRHGWYFPDMSVRGSQCCNVTIDGAVPKETC